MSSLQNKIIKEIERASVSHLYVCKTLTELRYDKRGEVTQIFSLEKKKK